MRRGVVVGKFYPPHRGHKFLIDTALSQVDHLTVMVCDHPSQTIPASLRAAWLREIHAGAHVVIVPDDLPDDDSSAWAKRTIEVLEQKPDVVFTSEDYGELYSRALGCEHVQVDRSRVTIPCSATQIRSAPLRHLEFLEPCVSAHYIPRICVVGAESTGKTTLAQRLADHYRCEWVAEYGREYSEGKIKAIGAMEAMNAMDAMPDYGEWTTEEFIVIAQEQQWREGEAARRAEHMIICDTDAFATGIWHERYMGFASGQVNGIGRDLSNRIYLLSDPSVPFVQDGLRDGERIREWMHQRFLEELQVLGRPFHVLSGSYEDRFEQAKKVIDNLGA